MIIIIMNTKKDYKLITAGFDNCLFFPKIVENFSIQSLNSLDIVIIVYII